MRDAENLPWNPPLHSEGLIRKKRKRKQSSLHRTDRFLHVHNSLELRKTYADIKGESILLIEDVFTTGATANEAARMLKWNGAREVILLSVFFREVDGDHAIQISLPGEDRSTPLVKRDEAISREVGTDFKEAA